ncbi:tail protein [Aureimonas sp. SA4125]|uniref:phage tail tape measure protein n=1 Tax=Aureimonas sp. SA4125 TaxID=2826993 RepID=UPI001CC77CF1|nr:phage tail tape measure protein [Aureimonas sp. SA4125]BDA83698.1 tail protein [Aureimonas sp. SA4125]
MADETLLVAVEADMSGFDKAMGDLTAKANGFGAAFGAALKGAVSGSRTLDGVLRQLGQRIASLALNAALKPLESAVGGVLQQVVGGLGGIFGGGAAPSVTPFAKGGVVAAPSYFPTGGGIGLMGEAGAEAIMPLKRGADGSLGVALGEGGRAAPTIVFNVTATDAASFRRSEAQIQAMLARAAQRGRRGL